MDFQSGIDISVVVPTYRGAESLRELVARAQALFAERGLSGEIVLVNDASPDSTWSVIGELTRDQTGVVGVDLLTNHGQARATLCGIAYAADVSSRRSMTICSSGPRTSGCSTTHWKRTLIGMRWSGPGHTTIPSSSNASGAGSTALSIAGYKALPRGSGIRRTA